MTLLDRQVDDPSRRYLYFAYGSNIPSSHMTGGRTPGASDPRAATLKDWVLQFNGCADIRPSEGAVVQGVVWEVSADNLRRLDSYEGCGGDPWGTSGFYRRVIVTVETERGSEETIVYVMNRGHDRLGMPSEYYFGIIKRGYEEFGLNKAHLQAALEDCGLRLGEANVGAMKADGPKRWIPIDAETTEERRAKKGSRLNRRQRRKEARRLEAQSAAGKNRIRSAMTSTRRSRRPTVVPLGSS